MSGDALPEAASATAPGPEEPASPDLSWTALEEWVWRKLQAGTVANIDEYETGGSRLPPADPGKPEDWQDGLRRLTPRFLEDLLLREPYRSKLHHKGVRIEGAWFDEGIDLEWPEVTGQIRLERCRFEQPIRFADMRTPRSVSFDGSAFADDLQLRLVHIGGEVSLKGAKVAGTLAMVFADIGQSLFMNSVPEHQAEFNDVDLYGAKVGGDVGLVAAKVARTLSMGSADIGKSLLMNSDPMTSEHQAEFTAVDLSGAKVGGDVSLIGAKVAGTLAMISADIGKGLLMNSVPAHQAEFNDVVLNAAKVDGQVSLIGAKVAGTLAMISADIGQSLLMNSDPMTSEHQAEFTAVDLSGAKVGGEISLKGAKVAGTLAMVFADIGQSLFMNSVPEHQAEFNDVDLYGAKVGGDVGLVAAKVARTLSMGSADIGKSLLMNSDPMTSEHQAEFTAVDLSGAKVGGEISLKGAKVAGTLAMVFADIGQSLFMNSVLEHQAKFNDVDLYGAKVGGDVGLLAAKVAGRLAMISADIGKGLFMDSVPEHRAKFNDVDLYGAKVGGDVSLIGAKVAGRLAMISADIGKGLSMNSMPEHQAEFNDVDLYGAKVGGDVGLVAAKVTRTLSMGSADIGKSLLMASHPKQRAEFSEVVLDAAKVGGDVRLMGAKVAGQLSMASADIGQSLLMNIDLSDESQHQAVFDGDVSLIFAEIGINLDVRGAVLSSLDLTGTKIGGELRLAQKKSLPRWQKGARLVLRDASVDVIQDTAKKTVWPPDLELDGFTYRRFSGLGDGAEAGVARRRSKWFTKTWLARDKPYTPQPYQRCAHVLREMGHPEMANDVLYVGRERERKQAWRTGNKLRGTGLTLLKWFIGYGFGWRLLAFPLLWVVALVVLGWVVLHLTGVPNELAGSEANVIAYSLDTLLPIVQLEKSHADIPLNGVARYYFYFQKLMGWALASFLIAGLSGLTK